MPQLNQSQVGDLLKKYGITNPTPEQESLFNGMDVIGGSAEASIAEYANYVKAEKERHDSDPLAAYQTLEQNFATEQFSRAQNLYTQLQDVVSSAPQLFGSLSPDQIQTYLAPLKQSFQDNLASVQGTMASRGLAASSTENNSLAQTGQRFQENVLSTGLQVGIDQQKQKAQTIQQQIQNLLGLGTQAQGEAGAAARQKSAQDLSQSNLIASLPYFLRSSGTSEANSAIAQARAKPSGFQKTFNQVIGDTGAFLDLGTLGVTHLFGGGGIGNPGGINTPGAQFSGAGAAGAGSLFQPNLPAAGATQTSTAAPGLPSLFATV